jgi:hypothetical protein
MKWNYINVDEVRIQQLASAFQKVEENLDALRNWEAAGSRDAKREVGSKK